MHSVRARITVVLVGIAALAVLSVAGTAYYVTQRNLGAYVTESTAAAAASAALEIDQSIWRIRRDFEVWTGLEAIENIRTADKDLQLSLLLRTLVSRYDALATLFTADTQGRICASSDSGLVGRTWGPAPVFSSAGTVNFGAANDLSDTIELWIRLRSRVDGQPLGTLVATLHKGYLSRLISSADFVGRRQTPRFFLVLADKDGAILGGPDWIGPTMSPIPGAQELMARTRGERRDVVQFQNATFITGRAREPGYEDFRGFGGSVVAYHDSAEALAIVGILTEQFVACAVLVLCISAVVGISAGRQIGRPIQDLVRLMRRAATGDLTVRAASNRHDEVGQLAGAFDRMATDLGNLMHKLEHASRVKSEFLSTMSHELRTPINVILGYTEMAGDGQVEPSRRAECLTRIDTAARDLLDLIESTLAIGKLDAGRDDVQLERIALPALWKGLRQTALGIPRNLKVELQWAEDVPDVTITTDPRKVSVIMRNLVGNALKFTEAGWVRVTAQVYQNLLILQVADTGIGINPADHERIFEIFCQGDQSDSRRFNGTGLGLYIVRRFVEQLGGDVTVESTPQRGATFRATLPCATPVRTQVATQVHGTTVKLRAIADAAA